MVCPASASETVEKQLAPNLFKRNGHGHKALMEPMTHGWRLLPCVHAVGRMAHVENDTMTALARTGCWSQGRVPQGLLTAWMPLMGRS